MQYDEDPSTPCPEDLDSAILGTLGELKRLLEARHGGSWKASAHVDMIDPRNPVTCYMISKEAVA